MSQRTIVEFNHDRGYEIRNDPAGFVAAIRHMLNSGSGCSDVADTLKRYGITVTPTCHHSTERRVLIGENFVKSF